tara:strand:- start:16951 stop:25440 length:8490 start_codon:yes stop_codon:yes gene_type:complete
VSEFIQNFRVKNPQYNDMPDDQLVTALHNKYYSDIPVEQFNQKIGFQLAQPLATDVNDTGVADITQPIEQQEIQEQQVDGFTGAAIKSPEEKSMFELVQEKASSIGGAISQGVEGAIPQFKQQVGGLLSQYEPMTKEEYKQNDPKMLGIITGGNADTYENFVETFKSANPVKTFLAEKGKDLVESGKVGIPQSQQFERGTPEYYAEAVTGSIINMAPTLAISLLGRRPDIGLGVMLAQVKGGSYQEGRDQGLTTQEAAEYSSMQTAAEVIPSAFPIAKIIKPTGKYLRDIIEAGVTEAAQETVTAALQSGIDKGYIKPDMTWGEAVERMIDGAIIGSASGVTISATTSPIAKKLQERDVKKQADQEFESAFDEALAEDIPINKTAIDLLDPDQAQLEKTSVTKKIETSELWSNLTPEEQAKFKEVLNEVEPTVAKNATVDIKEQPIDKAVMPEQEAVALELPKMGTEKKEVATVKPEDYTPPKPVTEYKGKDKTLVDTFGDSLLIQAVIQRGGLSRKDFELTGDLFKRGSNFKNGVVGKPIFAAGDKGMTADDFVEWAGEQGVNFEYGNDAVAYVQDLINKADPDGRIVGPAKAAEIEEENQREQAQETQNQEDITTTQTVIDKHGGESVHVKSVADNIIKHFANGKNFEQALDIEESRDSAATAIFIDKAIAITEQEITDEQDNPTEDETSNIKEKESFTLTSETEQERQQREQIESEADAIFGKEKKAKEVKAEVDKQVDDFDLTGSDRSADIAMSAGQGDIFAQEQDAKSASEFKSRVLSNAENFKGNYSGKPLAPLITDYTKTWLDKGEPLSTKEKESLLAKHGIEDKNLLNQFDSNNGFGSELLKEKQAKTFTEQKQQVKGEKNRAGTGKTKEKQEVTKANKRKVFNWDSVDLSKNYTAKELGEWITELSKDPDNKNLSGGVDLYNKVTMKKLDKLSWAVHHLIKEGRAASETTHIQDKEKKQADIKALADKKKTPLSEIIKEASDDTLTDSDRIPETYTAKSYDNFRETVAKQTATAKEILADAEDVIANKDKIIAELSERKFTKAMLQEIIQSPRNDWSKPQMVKQAYQRMLSEHVMASATFTIFGGSQSFEEQIIEKVRNQTQADVDQAYEKQREYRAEAIKRREEFVNAMENPETLSDFKEFIRVRGKEKMTSEQLAKYDELVSESLSPEDKPVVVTGEAEAIKTERAKTTHTKTGADLFVVKMVGRVDKDKFKELSAKSKQLGGYYSSYSKGEAIPGFQFKTVKEADQFEQLLSGADIDKSDFAEAKAEVKQSKNADKLLSMASKMEEKANEEINRPRQANTARRASMASNATERAEKLLALAKTVRNIATRLQEGDLTHLGKLSQVTQLEELISIQKRAIPQDLYENGSYDGYTISRPLKTGVTVNDYIGNVEFPRVELASSIVDSIANSLKGKRGYARLSAELRNLPTGKREGLRLLSNEQATKVMAASKAGILEAYSLSWLPDQVQTQSRLAKLGISTGEQLRAAIRELDSLKVAKRKSDPLKALERDLIGKKIEGYFPTPKELVDQMIDYADIQPGHEVLEPSAGKGNIAQEILAAAPDAILEVVEFNSGLRAILEAKGYNVVGNDFLEVTKNYDRIVMNPPFENFQDIEHVKHAFSLLKPGGKLVAIMGAGVKNSRKKAVEFREWLDDAGSYIEDLPDGSFKTSDRPTGVSTVMVTIEKNDSNTLARKDYDANYKPRKSNAVKATPEVFNAPGHNFIGMFSSMGIPERQEVVSIEGEQIKVPEKPQRIEPIISKLVEIMGRRIYFGKIKGKSTAGFYRPNVGEIRTRKKNDVEVLAHEMAHYLDFYSNVTLPNFKRLYKDPAYVNEVKALSYTDADNNIMEIEGFAEFVRLWLTNSSEAKNRSPNFYVAFNEALAKDKKLSAKMKSMRELMHKFYFQGPDKLGQALIGADPSYSQRFNQWAYRRDSRIRQQTIDKFHAARKIEQELTRKVGDVQESAWKQFRIANGGAEGISDYVLNYGTVNFDEKGDLKKTGESLHEVLQPVKSITLKAEHKGEQKIDVLLRYFAGRRALELHRQGRENLIPKETAVVWARLGKDYPVFESIQKDYQLFNERMMDFYEAAGMITPEGRETMAKMNKDYVPFNRIRDQLAGAPAGAGGGFHKLKGGTANLNDILVNIQDGITANVTAALNNRAKQRLYQYIANHKDGAIFATKIGTDSKPVQVYSDEMTSKITKILELNGIEIDGELDLGSKDLLTFWQHGVKPTLNESGNIVDSVIINGKPQYYEVQDPLLQDMLISMNPESYSSFMNVMFGVKNFFTRTITLGIEFMGANLVRDTVGATFLSKNNFKPFISSFDGMYSFIKKDEHYQSFMRSGGGYSGRLEASTREGTARRRVSIDEFGVMSIPEKLFSTIDNIASAFEYGTRIGEFKLAKKGGKSDMDAGFDAREISTDFSVIGANRFLTGYIRTVPFLNAMVQSQDRVFREAFVKKKYDGNPAGLAMKAFLGITIPTLVLYLFNKDDEDYKQIPDWEKRTNWLIKVGDSTGQAQEGTVDSGGSRYVKIPRPYDVGFVYATMPEIFFKYAEDDKGKEFAEGMIWTMTQMYGIDGVPAMMTGWWDLVKNEKWTGAPVVPKALADVSAPEQYTSNTAETFIRMGEVLGVSPIKAEHMFKAYTGYLGGYLLAATDNMLWDESKFGEKPEKDLSENIFLRRFLTKEVRPSTSAMEKFFDLKEKSDEIVSTFKQQVDVRRAIKGQIKEGQKFKDDKFFGLSGKEKEVLFALNDDMNKLIKFMYGKGGVKTAELSVKHNKKLTGKRKREELDRLWNSRNDDFMKYYSKADKALQKAKRESETFNQEK